MPSQLHEALLLLFRNRPTLAPELLRQALDFPLPAYTEARIESADLTELAPVEYRADLVVLLYNGKPVLGIVVEVQRSRRSVKRFSWPAYVVGLRARVRCPVCLLVVTTDDAVARWAARPIELGGGNCFTPLVVGPAGVPVITRRSRARKDPELAVLSALAHGKDADVERTVRIAAAALAASVGLDAERSTLYADLVEAGLSEAARKVLRSMDPDKYEYQSEFAKRYFARGLAKGEAQGKAKGEAKGKAEGKAAGKVELVLKLLKLRFGKVPAGAKQQVQRASVADLDSIAERVLTASTLAQALGRR